ncbi:MAG: hypothetical protein NTW08_01345 [Gammaproteobacteria bacterium]|nr:hypothetical protein [Gammaproteobacteria bacterium]
MPNPIIYWTTIFVPNDWEDACLPSLNAQDHAFLLTKFEEKCTGLLQGNYDGHWLVRKMVGDLTLEVGRLDKHRVMFYSGVVDNHPVLFLLKIFNDHDYKEACRSIQGRFRQLSAGVGLADYYPYAPPLAAVASVDDKLPHRDIAFYQGSLVRLDGDQLTACERRGRIVMSGPPGSGKTLLSIVLFERKAQHFLSMGYERVRLLYVTKSSKLVARARQDWAGRALPGVEADILTTDEFFRRYIGEKRVVDKADCLAFIERHLPKDSDLNAEGIYREFLLASEIINSGGIEAYHALGVRQSYFPAHKAQIYEWYQAYLAALKRTHAVHLPFEPITCPEGKRYDFVCVDESQDCSTQELLNLDDFAHDKEVNYFIDSHQSLVGLSLIRPYLLRRLGSQEQPVHHVALRRTYRLNKANLEVVNGLLRLKLQLFGGVIDELEYTQIIEQDASDDDTLSAPQVSRFDNLDKLSPSLGNSSEFAVVVFSEEEKMRAKAYFNTALVFTVAEVKGLEYEHVLVMNALSDWRCAPINKMMKEKCPQGAAASSVPQHRSEEKGQALDKRFNEFFTALSRVRGSLLFLQEDLDKKKQHAINELHQYVMSLMKGELNHEIQQNEVGLSREAWIAKARRLTSEGLIHQAEEILYRLGFDAAQVKEATQPVLKKPTLNLRQLSDPEPDDDDEVPPPSVIAIPAATLVQTNTTERMLPQKAFSPTKEEKSLVLSLMGKFDDQKIRALINSSNASALLFTYQPTGSCSLIFSWLQDKNAYTLFFKYLIHHETLAQRFAALCTADLLHKPCHTKGKFKGVSLFFMMTYSTSGSKLLEKYWSVFRMALTEDGLHQVVTGPGDYQGTSAFFFLAGTFNRDFLFKNWVDFKNGLTCARFHYGVGGAHKASSISAWFMMDRQGCNFMLQNWEDFKPLMTAPKLHQVIINLVRTLNGCELIEQCLNDFKPLLKASIHLAVNAGDDFEGATPLYFLACHDSNMRILSSIFNEIKHEITVAKLHKPITGNGQGQGETPFFYIDDERKWPDILV